MEGSILALVFAIILIISHIIKSIKEAGEVVKQQQLKQQQEQKKRPPGREKPAADDEIINIMRPKSAKQPKPIKHTLGQSSLSKPFGRELSSRDSSPPRRQALSKKLAPQGEGHRFEADPGTLDPSQILSPTIDPTVRPDLYSMTGIYEQGVQYADRSKPTISLNLSDCLAKPEGIVQAVILAEILNKPAWQTQSAGSQRKD